jgi:hypothetical protein
VDTEHGFVRNFKARSGRFLWLFRDGKIAGFVGQRRPRLESKNTSGQDVGHSGPTLIRRQARWVVEWSHGAPPSGVAHIDLRMATGALSGGNRMVNRLYLLTYPLEVKDDEEAKLGRDIFL